MEPKIAMMEITKTILLKTLIIFDLDLKHNQSICFIGLNNKIEKSKYKYNR